MRKEGAVHGLQAGTLHQMRQMYETSMRKGSLYGNPLCTKSRLQAGSGQSLLPGPLPVRLWLQCSS